MRLPRGHAVWRLIKPFHSVSPSYRLYNSLFTDCVIFFYFLRLRNSLFSLKAIEPCSKVASEFVVFKLRTETVFSSCYLCKTSSLLFLCCFILCFLSCFLHSLVRFTDHCYFWVFRLYLAWNMFLVWYWYFVVVLVGFLGLFWLKLGVLRFDVLRVLDVCMCIYRL